MDTYWQLATDFTLQIGQGVAGGVLGGAAASTQWFQVTGEHLTHYSLL